MRKLILAAVVAVFLVVLGFGVRKAKAQVSEIQPFTAVQTTITSGPYLKVPITSTGVLAVSGDGQLIAGLQQSHFAAGRAYIRTVYNKTARTRITIEPAFKMRITHPYHDAMVNGMTGGATCEGTPDGQIEGFEVNVKVHPVNSNEGATTWKRWAAPKLGCYILRDEETVTDKEGKLVRHTITTLSNIVIGEPDPSYFDTSLLEGYVDAKPEDYKGAVANHIKAQTAQQPQ
jgi:hypothetical protein